MPKHTNVVRFKVKAGKQAEFEEIFKSADEWDGRLMHVLAKTGDQTYVGYGLWESEEHMGLDFWLLHFLRLTPYRQENRGLYMGTLGRERRSQIAQHISQFCQFNTWTLVELSLY